MVNAPEAQEFRLPDVGEGLTEAEIVTWKVAVGDRVERDQALVEIETAKSLVELPSPFEGTVDALLVQEGETVPVGAPIVRINGPASPSVQVSPGPTAQTGGDDEEPAPSVLVGYGPSESGRTRRRRRSSGTDEPDGAPMTVSPARATPLVRKLAKDHGVDLSQVRGTGPGGRVVRADVVGYKGASAPASPEFLPSDSVPSDSTPERSGDQMDSSTTRIPVRGSNA